MHDFLARTNDTGVQLLSEHLLNVSDLSAIFSFYPNVSKLGGILHDLGKATYEFEKYLLDGGRRGSVVHALQGAFFADESLSDSNDATYVLLKEILSMAIAAHHGSLKDGVSPDGEYVFIHKLADRDAEKYHYQEAKQNIADVLPRLADMVENLISAAVSELNAALSQINTVYNNPDSAYFALGLLVKYIYSCLVDADRLDAYLFDVNEDYQPQLTDWDRLITVFERSMGTLFEKSIEKLGSESKIVKLRQLISDQCREAAEKDTGIYHLSVPTGGGKTLSSLRFALHHCRTKKKKRIIYVIPYLSIIEQTSSVLHEALELQEDNNIILEHHSNIVPPDDKEDQRTRKLSASRWDKPIIITTMVQFLETAMSSKGSQLRKFHNMSDAVIIFDEIQSLPVNTIHLFNETTSFLAHFCNVTILLCTATQPLLDKTERSNLLLEKKTDLIDCGKLFEDTKRTRIVAVEEKDVDSFAAFVSKKADQCGNCLAIVNTKNTAREVFKRLKSKTGFAVYHLSTSMCLVHRAETIAEIIKARKETPDKRIICVSTQLVEAGIDFSFSCVVRAAAGLDSVAQAAGRCNRDGESEQPKDVYVISIINENLDKLPDIKIGKEITERLIRMNQGADLLDPAIMEQFYKYYFHNRRNLMDYPVKDAGTVYEMLSINNRGKDSYRNRTGADCNTIIAQAFSTADEKFFVIDKNGLSVVVFYGEAASLIEDYRKQPKGIITKGKMAIIRKLEKFSVSLYSWEMDKLAHSINILDEETGILYLDQIHYSKDLGVVLEVEPEDYMV